MKREIYKELVNWKNRDNKKPLIIKGARQIGKTYIIRQFAKENYDDLIEINFERDLSIKTIFEKSHDPKELLEYFKIEYIDHKIDKRTLFFMDEIQACSDAITSLKFLSEDFPCDIICSGSALGVAIANSTSYPVRYVDTWEMFPMSFTEFLEAYGVDESIILQIKECIKNNKMIPEIIHEKMNELFDKYMLIGGMPEVVKTYIDTKSYADCLDIQRRIVNDYLNDMIKYSDSKNAIKIRECFSSIPVQLAKENKKFQYSVVKKGYNARHYDESLRWLEDSGLTLKVNRLKNIDYPLAGQVELSVFKIYMADVGLFISQLEIGDLKQIISGEMGIYKGSLYENVVAQILKRKARKAYYFEPSQETEIDFIIEYNGTITPIEVKANKHTASRSFNNYIDKYQPKYAFKFSKKNVGYEKTRNLNLYPLYALEFVLENESDVLDVNLK